MSDDVKQATEAYDQEVANLHQQIALKEKRTMSITVANIRVERAIERLADAIKNAEAQQ
jgi:primosomal protein N''